MAQKIKLPYKIDTFAKIRNDHFFYIDKTAQLLKLIESGERYLLSRPSGFGKSLALSTLSSMFKGEFELFTGLAAAQWVQSCSKKSYPVLTFDFSDFHEYNVALFYQACQRKIQSVAKKFSITLNNQALEDNIVDLVETLCLKFKNRVVVLIDNYDYPIRKTFNATSTVLQIYRILHSFYKSLESVKDNLQFIMLAGLTPYDQFGVFSTLENLVDISKDFEFYDLVGFTENEIRKIFFEQSSFLNLDDHVSADKVLNKTLKFSFKNHNSYSPLNFFEGLRSSTVNDNSQELVINDNYCQYNCLNNGDASFLTVRNFDFYVDKTELLIQTNKLVKTERKYICISRPRRFGKTISANMVASYYDYSGCAELAFKDLKISQHQSFSIFANQYIVIKITIQDYLSLSSNVQQLLAKIKEDILNDLLRICVSETPLNDLPSLMNIVSRTLNKKFVIVIDEWDCLFRDPKISDEEQENYLDFLRYWLKDRDCIDLVYMTGILPIKKYGTHSALNMFDEYSMLAASPFTEFVGFTESEVQALCERYHRDFIQCKHWYDGYQIEDLKSIYNPMSVSRYITSGLLRTYWSYTETYESLKSYITMEYFGLRDVITKLLANDSVELKTETFANDMKTFYSKDDVLTLLIHLGYLSYDVDRSSVRIPNKEIAGEFVKSIENSGWPRVASAIENSKKLLDCVLSLDAESVAKGIEAAHLETSQLTYNDENALAYTISLAFFAAREEYTVIREFPTGKGFADLVFLPRPHSSLPILLIELKWDQSAKAAISQIHERQYPAALCERTGKLLLVGISYDRKTKIHTCCIETWQL